MADVTLTETVCGGDNGGRGPRSVSGGGNGRGNDGGKCGGGSDVDSTSDDNMTC